MTSPLNGTLPLPTPDSWACILHQSKSRLALLFFLCSPITAVLINVIWQLVGVRKSNLPLLTKVDSRCALAKPTSPLSYFIGYPSWALQPRMGISLLTFSSSVRKRYVRTALSPYALTGVLVRRRVHVHTLWASSNCRAWSQR